MQLFDTKTYLVNAYLGICGIEVKSESTRDVVAALRDRMSADEVLDILETNNFFFETRVTVSQDIRYVLDCVGKEWVRKYPINAIKMVRKITDAGLRDSKAAVDDYLK